jgi:hypothetical protein
MCDFLGLHHRAPERNPFRIVKLRNFDARPAVHDIIDHADPGLDAPIVVSKLLDPPD